jgi:SAM-dependent methyltransferase
VRETAAEAIERSGGHGGGKRKRLTQRPNMSKRWRTRLIVYGLLAVAMAGGAWWLLEAARERPERDVIFAPTPPECVDKMLEMATVTKDDVVYDLGSGDGRIVIAAAKTYGCKAVGYEIDPKLVEESRRNAAAAGVSHLVEIHQRNIFDADLSDCTVLAIFLLPDVNVRLIPQMRQMKRGSRVVSFLQNMPGVRPQQTVNMRDKKGIDRTIYLWTIPLQME